MNSYFFLHHGMRASALKRQWDQDTPLKIDEGGTMGSIGLWTPVQLSETLRKQPGSKVQALGCLTQLSNDLSCPHLTILGDTIDDVGRHLWTSRIEVSPDNAGPDMLLGMDGGEGDGHLLERSRGVLSGCLAREGELGSIHHRPRCMAQQTPVVEQRSHRSFVFGASSD